MSDLFPGFQTRDVATSGATIHCEIGGSGPPLLMLHGYPQTHAMWHAVAPRLAGSFTVVVSDLRGYGDSSKPAGGANHVNYSKRAMASDQVELMRALGFAKFSLVGHDRGARVSHRLCVDHPQAVERVALLDISPTRIMYALSNKGFATAYYHWFFLIQAFDLPETLIGADPLGYLQRMLGRMGGGLGRFDPRALAEYERCFAKPETIHATCEDYRAAASIDLEHDEADVTAGRKVTCPLLVLWGDKGVVHRYFEPLRDWSSVAVDVCGRAVPSGHYIPEEIPDVTYAELSAFLRG